MSVVDTPPPGVDQPPAAPPHGSGHARWRQFRSTWRRLARNRLALVGLAVVSVVVLVALLAPLLPIPHPNEVTTGNRLQPIGTAGHPLGTDHLGRDLLSRLVWGSRTSLSVGLFATMIAAFVGSLVGLSAGFFGGWVDSLLMRSVDTLMAFPYLLLAIGLVAVLGPGLVNAMIAISVVNIPFFARAVRGTTLGLVSAEYIEAARVLTYSRGRILFSEVLPNVAPTIIVTMSTTIGWMITETAGLSFLGLGAQPPQADWGSMLGAGREYIASAPHVMIVPGLAIFLVVISLNFLGDGLRDALDPRLK
jgi:peptide/nickel transport system permease protein